MIAIVSDTCASIPADLVASLRIEVVPYYIHRGGETLRDMIDVKPDEFYTWLATAQKLPTTANPGPGDYLDAFRRVSDYASEIVVVNLTSKSSGAYQAACIARDMADAQLPGVRIEVIDTLQVAMIHGWATIEAARAARRGETIEQVVDAARYVSQNGYMFQATDNLRYLYMGGRIGRAKHLVGSLLNVKPIISMDRQGIIFGAGSARGWTNTIALVVELMNETGASEQPINVAVTHNTAPERAQRMIDAASKAFDVREILISQLSPALGVHTGPGMVGMHYFPLRAE
jgi:DegV family protein with EDD domain